MPDNEPYVPPMVLQPVPGFHNQTLSSSSSESDEGESDTACKPKLVKPLKGILKKPKMSEDKPKISDSKRCNDLMMPNKDVNENKKPVEVPMKEDDSVFKEALLAQPSPPCDNHSQSEVQSDNLTTTRDIDNTAVTESAKKVPFDSQVMPKRGILKRKGKFSTGDSGCDLNDLSRKDNSVSLSVRPMDLSEVDSAIDSPDGLHKFCAPHPSDVGAFSFQAIESQSQRSCSDVVTSDNGTSLVIPRRRGILKNANRDSDKRLSACSIGSNSSADILDFSYDSSDEILTTRFCHSTSKSPVDFIGDVDDRNSGHILQDDLFSYREAREVCKKALEITKNL